MTEGAAVAPASRAHLWQRPRQAMLARFTTLDSGGRRIVEGTIERLVLFLGLSLFGTGLLCSLGAATGLFRVFAPILLLGWAAAIVMVVVASWRKHIVWRFDRFDWVAVGLGIVAVVSAGGLHHHDFTGTFDTSFYLEDAIIISKTGGRNLYGPFDDELTGFRVEDDGSVHIAAIYGYASLAALFGYAGGVQGIWWVNGPLAFVAVVAIYCATRHLGVRWGAVAAAVLYQTSLLTLWFQRWTMTENASTAIFWWAVVLAFPLWVRFDPWRVAALGLGLMYGALVRPEGVVIGIGFLAVLALSRSRRALTWVRDGQALAALRRTGVVPVAVATIVLLVGLAAFVAYVLSNRHNQVDFVLGQAGDVLRGRPISDAGDVPVGSDDPSPNWGDYAYRYEWASISEYWFQWMLLIGLVGLALGVYRRREGARLLAMCAPYVLLAMMPPVTVFHPWFMRRIWIAFIPLAFVLASATLDPVRLGRRWTLFVGKARTPRPRPALAGLGIVLLLLLAGKNLDVTGVKAFQNEDDKILAAAGDLAAIVPADGLLIVDTGAAPFGPAVRIIHDRTIVMWFPAPHQGLLSSIEAADNASRVFMLTSEADAEQTALESPDGEIEDQRLNYEWRILPRDVNNYRAYINSPPLEQGYEPLAQYLATFVPPGDLVTAPVEVTLTELVKPVVIQRRVLFDPEDWDRGPQGMVSTVPNATLTFDPRYDYAGKTRPLALFLVVRQVDNRTFPIVGVDADGNRVLLKNGTSDGSGLPKRETVQLPRPMNLVEIELPQGMVLQGLYAGVSPTVYKGGANRVL